LIAVSKSFSASALSLVLHRPPRSDAIISENYIGGHTSSALAPVNFC
jgi:hypothetical protein